MKRATARILFVDDEQPWRVGMLRDGECVFHEVAPAASDDPRVLAEAAASKLRELGDDGRGGVVVALPSRLCLPASMTVDGARRPDREMLTFAMEDRLPIAAEDVVADFVSLEATDYLGIAVAAEPLRVICDVLRCHDVTIEHVCPAAILALQWLLHEHPAEPRDIVLWARDEHADLFRCEGGLPRAWRRVRMHRDALRAAVRAEMMAISDNTAPTIEALGREDSDWSEFPPENARFSSRACPMDEAALRGAAAVLRGTVDPWFDLTRANCLEADRLRLLRRPLRFAATAAAGLLLVTIAALWWRAGRYELLTRRLESVQTRVFSALYPGQAPPLDVVGRLRAEVRKARALGGPRGADVAAEPDAKQLLCLALAALPSDVRFRVDELRVEDGKLYVQGRSRSHGDAETLASALRGGGGFAIEATRSEQRGGSEVEFLIVGQAAGPPAVAGSLP
jgi:hypothetical protein